MARIRVNAERRLKEAERGLTGGFKEVEVR